MKVVSIDPSVNEVGWAVVAGLKRDPTTKVWDDSETDWKWGMWKIRGNSFSYKLEEIVQYIILDIGGIDEDDILIVEWPQFYSSERGQVAARQGYTTDLAAICTYIAGYFRLSPRNWHPITAPQWKGSVSKEITRRRFFKHMGIKQIYKINHNAVDAVMMLLEFCKRKHITLKIVSASMPPDYLESA